LCQSETERALNMNIAEYKIEIFKELLAVENENALDQIRSLIRTFLPKKESSIQKKRKSNYEMSFEEWNEQFVSEQNLNEFIPEYGTTLKDFRQDIYEAEMDSEGDMDLDDFLKELKTW